MMQSTHMSQVGKSHEGFGQAMRPKCENEQYLKRSRCFCFGQIVKFIFTSSPYLLREVWLT